MNYSSRFSVYELEPAVWHAQQVSGGSWGNSAHFRTLLIDGAVRSFSVWKVGWALGWAVVYAVKYLAAFTTVSAFAYPYELHVNGVNLIFGLVHGSTTRA